MLDPQQLYTVHEQARAHLGDSTPVMLHLLEGYVDAGQVSHQVSEHLLDTLDHELLAEFDHDQLHDYRSRRPPMVFDTNTWVSLTDFSLALHRVTDSSGADFLLLTGPEPDTQWNRATAAILGLADELKVTQIITAQGVPMGVPHTRPILVTEHATNPEVVQDNPVWIDRVTVPGSFTGMVEYGAGKQGLLGRGLVAHVPHYLAPGTYIPAAITVLERIQNLTGLTLPTGGLASQAQSTMAQLADEVAGDGELGPLVSQLEQQYDDMQANGRMFVPSADEIGAAAEQFLIDRGDHEDPDADD
ncbi:MAG: PAC2 family protein [Propioniciclava sp.]